MLQNTREELFSGDFDSLVICSEYDPYSIIEKLSPYLGGSASIVVHSPHSQIIVDLQAKMRSQPQYLAPSVTEAWTRRYQVLPGRTHPMMSMSGSGGFILHAIKIYDDPTAEAALLQRRPKHKKPKADGGESGGASTLVTREQSTQVDVEMSNGVPS